MKPIYERYRPRTWGDVIAQPKAVAMCRRLADVGIGGGAVWLSGPSGTGKTTLAYLLAETIADPMAIEELDATELTPARLADIERSQKLYSLGRGGRAFIINEAHGLRRDTVRKMLVMLERIPGHVAWIATTTSDGQTELFESKHDAGALLSRFIEVRLTNQGTAQPFAARLLEIATAEGLADGACVADALRIIRARKGNMRHAIQDIAGGALLPG